VLHALQNAGQSTTLKVARPPANETAAMYGAAVGRGGNELPHPTDRHLPMYEPYLVYGARFPTEIYTRGCHLFSLSVRLKLLNACDQ
jgi:hypothetical protein